MSVDNRIVPYNPSFESVLKFIKHGVLPAVGVIFLAAACVPAGFNNDRANFTHQPLPQGTPQPGCTDQYERVGQGGPGGQRMEVCPK